MAKTSLEQKIEELLPIIKTMPDAICIVDNHGEQVYSNDKYEIMLKRSSAETVSDASDITINGLIEGKVIVYHDISEVNRLRRELDILRQKLRKVETKYTFRDIIGSDEEMVRIINIARTAAITPATILLRGESGTGKEIFANAIHNASPRRNEKFVKINCASIPEDLLESELFGYREGAFTGALRGGRKGLFQDADHGTLFLDEVGDVSSRMQVKLLRALQEKEVLPVGSTDPIAVDVRIICATNKPLEEMVESGTFREDLYYRLNVFPLFIPPLRERLGDIGAISAYLINQYNEFYQRSVISIEPDAVELLKTKDWPGNVRELENVLSRAFINLPQDAQSLTYGDIASALGVGYRKSRKSDSVMNKIPTELGPAVEMTERACISSALSACDGDKNTAAVMLGIPVRTLYYKCKKLGL